MIPDNSQRRVETHGKIAGTEFGISLEDSAHIMTILRDTLYTDKIMAVLREYSANAWDSHRMSGKPNLPIDVHIPTHDDPALRITDHGPGLSREDIFEVYTQYGASTKRSTSAAVGMLGIGSKSGFAYSDTFTVISCHGGTRSFYAAALDSSDKGVISLLSEEPCGDETGISIEIAVKDTDIGEFVRKAEYLYANFDPRPNINITISPPKSKLGTFPSGIVFAEDNSWGGYNNNFAALMGCVPYRVDLGQVEYFEEGLPRFARSMSGLLFFNIGEVHINASREELKYSDKTKRAILDKINSLASEFVAEALKKLADPAVSNWDKRILCNGFSHFEKFIPKDFKQFTESAVNLESKIPRILVQKGNPTATPPIPDVTSTLFLLHSASAKSVKDRWTRWSISVQKDVRFIIRDDNRSMRGFNFGYNDLLLVPGDTKPSVQKMEEGLKKMCELAEIDGVSIVKTSQMTWVKPIHSGGAFNPKRFEKNFVYKHPARRSWGKKNTLDSSHWEIVEREATDDDVYVNICSYRPVDIEDFWERYNNDKQRFELFGIDMPEVYGYKIPEKESDNPPVRQGMAYNDWRAKIITGLAELPQFQELLSHNEVKNTFYGWSYKKTRPEFIKNLAEIKAIPFKNPVTEFIDFSDRIFNSPLSADNNITSSAARIVSEYNARAGAPIKNVFQEMIERIKRELPMLKYVQLGSLVEESSLTTDVIEYVKAIQSSKEKNP